MVAFLIVDGDRNFRDALAIGLRLDGHPAVSTGDVEQASELLRSARFDCCLVDAHLPGAEALLEVAADAGVHAIAASPHPDLLEAAASRHPRAAAMVKPFQSMDLVARARQHASAA